ncbi:MAG: transcriptional regulator MntR [Thermoanaerobacteraceae bacterium]|nr:transcriptional regulator MntR [Thermoanaerobacteraceae bacterium]
MQAVLTGSMEDYLEMIYQLAQEKGIVRVSDLAAALGVRPSSATRMVRKLCARGLVHCRKYRDITLTPAGEKLGRFLLWRDRLLKEFLLVLGVENGVAEQVEGIEHFITPATMRFIRDLVDFLREHPGSWAAFRSYRKCPRYPDDVEFLGFW